MSIWEGLLRKKKDMSNTVILTILWDDFIYRCRLDIIKYHPRVFLHVKFLNIIVLLYFSKKTNKNYLIEIH